jgi:Flp pilus assembly protein TadD
MSGQASRARDLLVAKRPDEAIKVLLAGLSSAPDNPELHCLLAQAHFARRRPVEALKAATDAVTVAPEMEWAHRLRSIALRQLRRNREAIEAGMQAVRLEPSLAVAHQTLAEAHLSAGHSNDAYAIAFEARRLEPESSGVHDLLGRCLLSKKQFADAEAAFRQELQLDPNDPVAHNNLGVALQRQGRRVDAVHAFTAAAKIDPTFETARKNVYSGTQRLVGGGVVVIALITLGRLSVLLNSIRHPSVFTALIAVILLGGLVWFLIRNRRARNPPDSASQLPETAVAYYKAETRRLKAQRRPIQWLRSGGILVAIGMLVLGFIFDSALFLILALPAAAAWYALSPMIWRRFVRCFFFRGDAVNG